MATEAIIEEHLTFTLKRAANRKNPWPMGIDVKYAMDIGERQKWRCAITGDKLSFTRGVGRKNPKICSVDRINSSKGYVPGNIQLVTWQANQIKGKFSTREFISLCRKAVNHRSKL